MESFSVKFASRLEAAQGLTSLYRSLVVDLDNIAREHKNNPDQYITHMFKFVCDYLKNDSPKWYAEKLKSDPDCIEKELAELKELESGRLASGDE